MGASITDEWSYRGFQAVVLENERLRVAVLPGHGAKITELVSKQAGRDLLYHHPRYDVRPPVFGANVDNWWTGGIDEILPTVVASTVEGEELPYLGELWSQPWHHAILSRDPDHVVLRLWVSGIITPVAVERHLELRAGEPFLRATYRVTNVGPKPVPFIWGLHPGIDVHPGMTVQVPGSLATFVEGDPALGVTPGAGFSWPLLPTPDGLNLDMSVTQPPDPPIWGLFRVDLDEGWLAVLDTVARSGFGMTFDASIFPYAWLWLVYGGYRGMYCANPEVWTSPTARLDEAIASNTAFQLTPGGSVETEARYIALDGVGRVSRIAPDGTVTPEL